MTETLSKPPVVTRIESAEWEPPAAGTWLWVKDPDDKKKWLGCVTHIGTNYIEVEGVEYENRILFEDVDSFCSPAPDAETYLANRVETHRQKALKLMNDVKLLTAKLSVTTASGNALTDGTSETQALALRSDTPLKEYKQALIKAEKTQLPDLFKKIRDENEAMGEWMKAQLIPLQAEVQKLEPLIDAVKARIFNVELYAGLVEEIEKIKDGEPAPPETKIHLFQRRLYMDEECLAEYQTGGMEFKSLGKFDAWVVAPENLSRLLPFPRCMVAFQVRRHAKEREIVSFSDFIKIYFSGVEKLDKLTFLYIRNGEQVYRLATEIEFGERLFPDLDKSKLDGRLWAEVWGSGTVDDLVSEEEYLAAKAEYAACPKGERWRLNGPAGRLDRYKPFDRDNVYYDDIAEYVQKQIDEHNRIVLVLQGLLDRSPVLHPHPPWKIWTAEGFEAAFELIYDVDRALSPGEAPDFEVYRAKLNASLKTGSITVGQEEYWEEVEAERENERQAADWRIRYEHKSHYQRFRPYNDSGPGTLARVEAFSKAGCTYRWERERKRYSRWADKERLPRTLRVPLNRVLNVDAYTPGDFRLFFADPRTRADYLQWAPLLLEAEEYHAGNRQVGNELACKGGKW